MGEKTACDALKSVTIHSKSVYTAKSIKYYVIIRGTHLKIAHKYHFQQKFNHIHFSESLLIQYLICIQIHYVYWLNNVNYYKNTI